MTILEMIGTLLAYAAYGIVGGLSVGVCLLAAVLGATALGSVFRQWRTQ